MLTKIKLTDGTIIEVDTIRENYFIEKNNEGTTRLTFVIDTTENVGSIDDFKTKFTEENLNSMTAIADDGNTIKEFVGYTQITNLSLSLTSAAFHYEFSFVRPIKEDIVQA